VIILGRVEGTRRRDFGFNLLLEPVLDRLLRRLGELLFFVVAVEDGAAILLAGIAELAVLRERIDIAPEMFAPAFHAVARIERHAGAGSRRAHVEDGHQTAKLLEMEFSYSYGVKNKIKNEIDN